MSQLRLAGTLAIVSVIALTSGCVSIDFKEPISTFSGTMSQSSATLKQYYSQLNSFERDLYLQRAYYNPSMRLAYRSSNGQSTGLIAQFPPEAIQARIDALALITAYGERLTALAGADAPQNFNTGAQTLGTNLGDLYKQFQTLDKSNSDPTAIKYIGPVKSLAGAIGELYLDRKREEKIRVAIKDGAPAINNILDALEVDMSQIIAPLQNSGADVELAEAVGYYNEHRICTRNTSCLSTSEREQLLNRIRESATRRDDIIVNNPSEVVRAMRDANAALLKYAQAPRDPQSLASLVAALELFNKRVQPIADAVAGLKEK